MINHNQRREVGDQKLLSTKTTLCNRLHNLGEEEGSQLLLEEHKYHKVLQNLMR